MKKTKTILQEIWVCDQCGAEENVYPSSTYAPYRCARCDKEICSKCQVRYEFQLLIWKGGIGSPFAMTFGSDYFTSVEEGIQLRTCKECGGHVEAGLVKLGFRPFRHEMKAI